MSICDNCGIDFKYPSKLLRHLNKKYKCQPIENVNVSDKNVNVSDENVNVFGQNVEFVEKSKFQCENCKKVFSSRQGKSQHKKNVKCIFVETSDEKIARLEKENEELRNSQNNNYNTTINNNQVYNIVYVKDSGSLVHSDPSISDNEVLCIEGFQREALINKRLGNVNYTKLKRLIVNLIDNNEYDELFKFLFRDDKNRRMHFMSLGKNVGTTYYEIFDKGKVGKTEKDQLFNRVMGFLCGHLTLLDNSFAILNKKLFTKQSKRSFENVLREPSEQFNMFQNLLE